MTRDENERLEDDIDEEEVDLVVVRRDPPRRLAARSKAIHENIQAVRRNANHKWYRIARFKTVNAATGVAARLRKDKDLALFEFYAVRINDDPEGWKSELLCKWLGVPGSPGRTAHEEVDTEPKLSLVQEPREDHHGSS